MNLASAGSPHRSLRLQLVPGDAADAACSEDPDRVGVTIIGVSD